MDLTGIISVVTVIVTFILGIISKKSKWVSNNLIPLQNLLIGVIACIVDWVITKDFNGALIGVGLFTGGVYDLGKNLKSLTESNESSESNESFENSKNSESKE